MIKPSGFLLRQCERISKKPSSKWLVELKGEGKAWENPMVFGNLDKALSWIKEVTK